MHLELIRRRVINEATEGDLWMDGQPFCRTLEDPVREDPNPATPENEGKIWGRTAIPAGEYAVILNVSPRFHKILPRILKVPGFEGILIHTGNGPENTEGCVLVGERVKDGRIPAGTSTPAFLRLMAALDAAKGRGEAISISVRNELDGAAHA